MSIILQGSTSGSVTLQEPAVAGTTVLDLPATSGTILTTASSGQSIPKAALPTGSVLQVVSSTITTEYNGTTGAETYFGIAFSITPTSATSKIMVIFDVAMGLNGTTSNHAVYMRLRRAASTSGTFLYVQRFGRYDGGSSGNREMFSTLLLHYLDSPNTTSTVTYGITIQNLDGAPGYSINNNGHSTLTLMEIAA